MFSSAVKRWRPATAFGLALSLVLMLTGVLVSLGIGQAHAATCTITGTPVTGTASVVRLSSNGGRDYQITASGWTPDCTLTADIVDRSIDSLHPVASGRATADGSGNVTFVVTADSSYQLPDCSTSESVTYSVSNYSTADARAYGNLYINTATLSGCTGSTPTPTANPSIVSVTHNCSSLNDVSVEGSGWTPNASVLIGIDVQDPNGNSVGTTSGKGTVGSDGTFVITTTKTVGTVPTESFHAHGSAAVVDQFNEPIETPVIFDVDVAACSTSTPTPTANPSIVSVTRDATNNRVFIVTGKGFVPNELALGSLSFTVNGLGVGANGQSTSDANGNVTITETVTTDQPAPTCNEQTVVADMETFDASKNADATAHTTVTLPDSCATPTPTPTPTNSNGSHKVTICHRTDSDSNPYVVITVDTDAAGGGKDKGISDHLGHTGPVWSPELKAQHVKWGDIIPPYTDDQGVNFPGYNWDVPGQKIYNNDCTKLEQETPTPTGTPTSTPTPTPTGTPSSTPTQTPTSTPTQTPTTSPSSTPTNQPSPSTSPTSKPKPSHTPVATHSPKPTTPVTAVVETGADHAPAGNGNRGIGLVLMLIGGLGVVFLLVTRRGAEKV